MTVMACCISIPMLPKLPSMFSARASSNVEGEVHENEGGGAPCPSRAAASWPGHLVILTPIALVLTTAIALCGLEFGLAHIGVSVSISTNVVSCLAVQFKPVWVRVQTSERVG